MAKYARFETDDTQSYGIVTGDQVAELQSGLFEPMEVTGRSFPLSAVKLLPPCAPSKILAVGLNYRSHVGDRKVPETPEIFYKPVSSLQNPDDAIIIPTDALDAHFEGELVAVIGKTVSKATREEAEAAVFGVTCGNDVSDRNWQRGADKDNQWWRAKGCDTFAPLGPAIVTDVKYSNLALRTRVNGETLQDQRTDDLIFDVPTIISFVSNWVTLFPGDLIYTGTPGNTRRLVPGDVVEVELESIGVLRNPVSAD